MVTTECHKSDIHFFKSEPLRGLEVSAFAHWDMCGINGDVEHYPGYLDVTSIWIIFIHQDLTITKFPRYNKNSLQPGPNFGPGTWTLDFNPRLQDLSPKPDHIWGANSSLRFPDPKEASSFFPAGVGRRDISPNSVSIPTPRWVLISASRASGMIDYEECIYLGKNVCD